ncbi:hypothetical protein PG985_011806 [Apiospora marii]|uniref:uncharacterized protein n=1 Tax=Apiospora marii TaxID=335849 RepID=UPI00312FA05E
MPETRGKAKAKANPPAAPLTSGNLHYVQKSKGKRMRRAKAVMEKVLSNTPAFTSLAADKQALARTEIIDLINENIDDFMDHTPPRSVYPPEQAVLNAVDSVFHYNEDVFGIRWTNNLFKIRDVADDDGDDAEGTVDDNGDKSKPSK